MLQCSPKNTAVMKRQLLQIQKLCWIIEQDPQKQPNSEQKKTKAAPFVTLAS